MRYSILVALLCLGLFVGSINARPLHINTIVSQWGSPDIRNIHPNGNEELVYRTFSQHTYPKTSPAIGVSARESGAVITVQPPTNQNVPGPTSRVLTCETVILINKRGYVIRFKSAGSDCPRLNK